MISAVCAYLDTAMQSTPEARRGLIHRTRLECMNRLPFDTVLEQFRGPMQNLSQPHELFSILDDNIFFLDLLTAEVVTACELRQRYFASMTTTPATMDRTLLWLITSVCSREARVLLHFSRDDSATHYTIHHLFLCQEELEKATVIHESVLFAFVALADQRHKEIRVSHIPELPLACFLLSLLGFLREDGQGLLRPPINEVVDRTTLLRTVRTQIDRLMHAQIASLLPDGTGGE